MSISPSIEAHLDKIGIEYDLIDHPYSMTSIDSARLAHIPPYQLAKAVIVHDHQNYRMCLLPSTNKMVIPWLNKSLNSNFKLASEEKLDAIFNDCERGAVPALGQVYGLPVTWDNSLEDMKDIYFESGDHRTLVHVKHSGFMELMGLQDHTIISCANDEHEYQTHLG